MKRRTFVNRALKAGLGVAACSLSACRQPGDTTIFHTGTRPQEFWALDLDVQELARRYLAAPIIE